ncbi:hypothetical protein KPL70_001200 [Citrus sinensis]|nr:hypothetical protein KPL70_001200 [Citrus sinensis]
MAVKIQELGFQKHASRTLQDASGCESHEQWMARCGCVYNDNIEKEKRSNIFKQNVARIEAFNNKANNEKPYKLAVNVFADLTNEEFKVSRETDSGATCVPNKQVHSSMKMSPLCLPLGTEERKVPSHPSRINNNASRELDRNRGSHHSLRIKNERLIPNGR